MFRLESKILIYRYGQGLSPLYTDKVHRIITFWDGRMVSLLKENLSNLLLVGRFAEVLSCTISKSPALFEGPINKNAMQKLVLIYVKIFCCT